MNQVSREPWDSPDNNAHSTLARYYCGSMAITRCLAYLCLRITSSQRQYLEIPEIWSISIIIIYISSSFLIYKMKIVLRRALHVLSGTSGRNRRFCQEFLGVTNRVTSLRRRSSYLAFALINILINIVFFFDFYAIFRYKSWKLYRRYLNIPTDITMLLFVSIIPLALLQIWINWWLNN